MNVKVIGLYHQAGSTCQQGALPSRAALANMAASQRCLQQPAGAIGTDLHTELAALRERGLPLPACGHTDMRKGMNDLAGSAGTTTRSACW
jgi:hypothetical protein